MGKVLVSVKIENLSDLYAASQGTIATDTCRTVEVADALVDTGASGLSMPRSLIQQLGLTPFGRRVARSDTGNVELQVFSAVRLSVQDRDCICDVTELPDASPVRLGKIALHMLDFVVDPVGQRLICNPAHGGEHMIELY